MDHQGLVQGETWLLPSTRTCGSESPCLAWMGVSGGNMSFQHEFFPQSCCLFCLTLLYFWEMVDDCLVVSDWEVSLHLFSLCASRSGCWSPLLGGYFNFDSTSILLWRVVQDCVCAIQDLTPCREVIIFAVLVYFVFLTVLKSFCFS